MARDSKSVEIFCSLPRRMLRRYVSQEMVWDDLGEKLLSYGLAGFNCTVFAYGQTGAGKSYSVVGYKPNDGLIPNLVARIFDCADACDKKATAVGSVKFEVEVAMLEVYMDKVYDLLQKTDPGKPRQELKVFRTASGEVMIYDPADKTQRDKIWHACTDRQMAEMKRALGEANRTIRSTSMNPSSSRGHTVFMVRITKLVRHRKTWDTESRKIACGRPMLHLDAWWCAASEVDARAAR